MPIAPDDLRRRVAELGWYHSIDLGNGIVTPGLQDTEPLADELFPDCAGRSVLDVGAWDGLNSFRVERLGASRVVALDHYVWGVDLARRQRYWEECAARGELPDHRLDLTEFWDEGLPGRRGFELASAALDSSVEAVTADLMTADLEALGRFDVVLYLGVLYHMAEPLTALRRVRQVTGEVAVIETVALRRRGSRAESLLAFVGGNDLQADFGNWYVPTEAALHALCRAAGFSSVTTVRGCSPIRPRALRRIVQRSSYYRVMVHARC